MVKIISIELISQLDISQLMSVRVCQLLIISLCQTFHYYVRLSVVTFHCCQAAAGHSRNNQGRWLHSGRWRWLVYLSELLAQDYVH